VRRAGVVAVIGSKRSRPWGQRFTHSPQVRQLLSVTGSLRHTCRRTSMPMGQWNEHMPHCTQRLGSGVTHAVASAVYLALSAANQSMMLMVAPRFAPTRHSRMICARLLC
jgi:hypothetical protein